MKTKAFLVFLFVAMFFPAMAQAQTSTSTPQTIRVASWNIERGLQYEKIVEAMREINADIWLLQEVDVNARRTGFRNVAQSLGRDLGYPYVVFSVEFQELGQGKNALHGQAVLSRYPLKLLGELRFKKQSKTWSRPYRKLAPGKFQARKGARVCQVVAVQIGTHALVFYNTHLESQFSETNKAEQFKEIVDDMERNRHGRVVIAGDLNTKYGKNSPVVTLAKKVGLKDVFPEGVEFSTQPGKMRRIDWIFVSSTISVRNAKVFSKISASDHYPLAVEIDLGP